MSFFRRIAILGTVGIGVLAGMTVLPRHLPSSLLNADLSDATQAATDSLTTMHALDMETDLALELTHWASTFAQNPTNDGALRLAATYVDYYRLDSAAKYLGALTTMTPSLSGVQLWHRAILLAEGTSYAASFLATAQPYLVQLQGQPLSAADQLRVQIIEAYWQTRTATPMRGILSLKSILAEAPTNEEVLWLLGILSFESAQDKKGIGYMEKLLHINPAHIKGLLYLGEYYLNQTQQTGRGKDLLRKAQALSDSPAVKKWVDEYVTIH